MSYDPQEETWWEYRRKRETKSLQNPTEEMLIAGEEAYHSAPRDEDGCTQMRAAFLAMIRVYDHRQE